MFAATVVASADRHARAHKAMHVSLACAQRLTAGTKIRLVIIIYIVRVARVLCVRFVLCRLWCGVGCGVVLVVVVAVVCGCCGALIICTHASRARYA